MASIPEAGEEEDGPLLPRDFAVMGPEWPDLEYTVGVWSFGASSQPGSCEVVVLGELGARLLVVVPNSVWHRKPAKRLLPRNALTKVLSLDVEPSPLGL